MILQLHYEEYGAIEGGVVGKPMSKVLANNVWGARSTCSLDSSPESYLKQPQLYWEKVHTFWAYWQFSRSPAAKKTLKKDANEQSLI